MQGGASPMHTAFRIPVYGLVVALTMAIPLGCGGSQPEERGPAARVVVYSAQDEEFARPVFLDYVHKTGVRIEPKYDTESTKTVGLAGAILAEADRPVCDLFWNNEILNTLRSKRAGRLAPFHPSHGAAIPAAFRAGDGTWYGFAARARILLVNTRLVPEGQRPGSIRDLVEPKWKGRIGLAKPLFGTTATHAVCLFHVWGTEPARAFFRDLKRNEAQILAGNKPVAQAVGGGQLAFGLTDTDDALEEIAAASPVAIVYPDREPDQLGTLFIPNTLAVIQGAPHAAAAEQLADYLLSPEVERALAEGPSGQIPLNASVTAQLQVETPRTVKPMSVDFEAAAAHWDEVAAFLAAEFATN